ncbi:Farnesyl pyrophosphate synthase [Aphelenchoides besseyi]|nr:Farnesyl pyrophosphate synthase [Aphelenchoides besseyi]
MSSRALIQSIFGPLARNIGGRFCRNLRGREREKESAHLERLLDHCMGNGKFARSVLAVDTFRALRPNASDCDLQSAAKIATSLEFLQSFFLVLDDVMDGSEMRRGKACWYKMPGVGLQAINHGLQLDLAAFEVIRSEMCGHPKQHKVLEEIHDTKMITVTGQNLDCRTAGIEDCNWERYEQLVSHKTAHYSYTLPIRIGFHLADRLGYETLTELTHRIGYLFQAQDDFLDCFGDSTVTGKNSTDLADGKCTWFSCAAMQMIRERKVDEKLARQFTENYGNKEGSRKALAAMQEMKLSEQFRRFEERQVNQLNVEVQRVQTAEIRPVLADVVRTLQGRKN